MSAPPLRCGLVLRVQEEACEVRTDDRVEQVRFAAPFPRPRVERVSPGHLVAVAGAVAGPVVVWRWYDAVVLGPDGEAVRLWEPAHGEVLAAARDTYDAPAAGSRAWASAGLPGADWWVCGPVGAGGRPDDLVDLDEVRELYSAHGLWDDLA